MRVDFARCASYDAVESGLETPWYADAAIAHFPSGPFLKTHRLFPDSIPPAPLSVVYRPLNSTHA